GGVEGGGRGGGGKKLGGPGAADSSHGGSGPFGRLGPGRPPAARQAASGRLGLAKRRRLRKAVTCSTGRNNRRKSGADKQSASIILLTIGCLGASGHDVRRRTGL